MFAKIDKPMIMGNNCNKASILLNISCKTIRSIHKKVNLKNGQMMVFDRLLSPPSILLLAAIGAKLIGP